MTLADCLATSQFSNQFVFLRIAIGLSIIGEKLWGNKMGGITEANEKREINEIVLGVIS